MNNTDTARILDAIGAVVAVAAVFALSGAAAAVWFFWESL